MEQLTYGRPKIYEYFEPIKLDIKDKRILFELLKNARIPYNRIAKSAKLSNDAVKYRINKLLKGGLFLGSAAIVNFSGIGYHWNIVLLQMKNFHKETEELLTDFFKKIPNVLKVMKCSGRWDLQLDVIYQSLIEFEDIINKIKSEFEIKEIETLRVLKEDKYHQLPLQFFKEINREHIEVPYGRVDEFCFEQLELDEKDKIIIEMLTLDGRKSLIDIADKINLSSDGTKNRIQNLVKSKIIRGYMPIFNSTLIGYDVYLLFFRLKKPSKSLISFLKTNPNVLSIYRTGDKYNLFVDLAAKDPGDFNRILIEIRTKFKEIIEDYESLLALKEFKYSDYPEG